MGTNPMNLTESHFDNLINDIKRGWLIPVVGGDINLCGRPQDRDGHYVSWQDHKDKANGKYYPPTAS